VSDRPSWIGGVDAPKAQTGWLFKILKKLSKLTRPIGILIEQPPRRFFTKRSAPPLSRRGDRSLELSAKYVGDLSP